MLTLNTFNDAVLHFLDIEMHPDGLGIYLYLLNPPIQVITPIMQDFLHGAIKLHG